jgi:hypothetical protein
MSPRVAQECGAAPLLDDSFGVAAPDKRLIIHYVSPEPYAH